MYIRTYFDKDNTIVRGSTINMGANPIGTLFFGGSYSEPEYSRYIFHFPTDKLREMYGNCLLGDLSNTTHKLVFKPTRFFGSIDKNIEPCLATAYELCLFPINQDWVEGCGYDFNCVKDCAGYITPKCNSNTGASNWYFAQDGVRWQNEGVFDAYFQENQTITGTTTITGETYITGTTIGGEITGTTIVTGQTFITGETITGLTPYISCLQSECSDCLLEYDVTNIVNNFITGNTPNYGFGLAFHRNYEINPTGDFKYVGVYSRETPNFFKPYLETEYLNPIVDDRANFYVDKDNKLYLYVNLKGQPTNLDENPIVEIYDEQDRLFSIITGNCVTQGVYAIDLYVPPTGTTDCVAWRDVWTNIKINGRTRPNIELEFELKSDLNYYNIGIDRYNPKKYAFKFHGIKRNENIRRGDIRKIVVDCYEEFNSSNKFALDNIFYRLYVKEGVEQLDVIKWTPMNMGICENFIYLDTSWMLPQNYYLDFKVISNREERLYPDQIKFYILDDKVVC